MLEKIDEALMKERGKDLKVESLRERWVTTMVKTLELGLEWDCRLFVVHKLIIPELKLCG